MGFDNECIVNIQSLLGEYFCPVCRQLVYPSEALQAQCTHLYCKPCLPYVANSTKACPYDGYLVTEADSKPLVESNKVLADTIGKISVYCLYHRSGCTWQGPLSECTSHCSGCTFGNSPVVCNRCGVQIVHRQVQEHAQSCSGVQPQQQKPDSVQDAATTGTGAASGQSQVSVQAAATTSLAQTSQAPAASQSVPDSNQQASASSQTQAVNATVPTQEQWYQQQQQYQQYYQQYPGYDPYQQHYQQYYPYQQQAVPHYQQPAQQQPQAYGQSQMQPQAQQLQSQMQPQAQQQPQVASAVHPQSHPQVASNSQQAAPTMQSQSQYQVQNQTSSHALPHPPTQTYPPAQLYAQHPQAAQPLGQQHTQMTQYQQTNPQMQQSTPPVHPQAYPHPHPHPHPQQYTHAQSQPQLQGQLPSHPNPQPPVHLASQPSQTVNPSAPVQTQHPSANAVTGYQSYQQPQLAQNAQPRPMTGPYQQPQHPAHMQTQFPQQPTQMRPPQSHAMISNQQQVTALPGQVQPPNAPAQQVPGFAHPQQSGYPVQQRPGVLPGHHAMAQQYAQQPSFPGQGPFLQQQSSVQAQGLPQAPPQLNYQSHAVQANMAQNYVGRPPISQAAGPHAYAQAPTGPGHIRAMQPGGNQLPASQSHPLKATSQISQTSEHPGVHVNLSSKPIGEETNSQNPDSKKNDSILGMQSVDINHVKSESDIKYTNEQKSIGENMPQLDGRELSQQKQMLGGESESHLAENGASAEESKLKVKEEVSEDRAAPLPNYNPAEIAFEDRKDKQPKGSGAQGIPTGSASMSHQSQFVSQVPGSNSLPPFDHGRNPLQPLGSIPQRPAVSTGAPHNLTMTGHTPGQPRPQGPGQFPLPGQHLGAPDYPNMPVLKQPPTSVYAENQSSASFGRGPSNLGPGHASHVQQRNPQADPFAVPPFPPQPTATSDPHGGVMGRAPVYPSDNGPGYFDGRQPDSHFHGHMERGAYGQPPVGQSNAVKINDPLGHDRSPRIGLRDERFKLPPEELLKPYPAPMQHPVNRRDFEEDLNKFPRPSHLDSGPSSKFGGHFPSSGALDQGPRAFGLDSLPRSFENAPHGFDRDPGMKGTGTFPPRFLPPFTDTGDRHRPGGFPDDTIGRAEFGRTHPDFQRPVPGFGRHHMDGLTSRSPGREYTDPPHRFGGFPGDVDGNEFGEGSKPFDIPLDSLGKPIHSSRFPPPPSHFRRGDFDLRMADPLAGPLHNNLRAGDAQDMLPTHIRRGGPHGMPLGEATRFGPFGSHPQMGEPSTGGNFPPHRPLSESFGRDRPAHPRIGEPGFRSRYALDSGFLHGAMEPFDNSRKRKAGSIMCRICKLDCETVEGLDLHSQTREHQKRAMDMVLAIKQQNKKQKTPGDRPSVEDRSKSRVAGLEGRTKKH